MTFKKLQNFFQKNFRKNLHALRVSSPIHRLESFVPKTASIRARPQRQNLATFTRSSRRKLWSVCRASAWNANTFDTHTTLRALVCTGEFTLTPIQHWKSVATLFFQKIFNFFNFFLILSFSIINPSKFPKKIFLIF